MGNNELNVVTGSFGYTGKYITRLLLSQGERVLALTGHPDRHNPFGDKVSVVPFDFDDPKKLAWRLEGATTLFNTYWIRFSQGAATHSRAVANTRALLKAAEEAGVRRVVHISITSASPDSPLPYFQGKGLVEQAITQSKLSHAIIRPALIFGDEDILINNIAWLLRRFPLFAVPGSGSYKLQPIFVEELAELAIGAARREGNEILDAVGPEVFTFDALVRLVAKTVQSRTRVVHVEPGLALLFARLIGRLVGDVLLTEDEVAGLTANLLVSQSPPLGHTRLSDWLARNADRVGARYASEVKRHYH